MTLLNTLRQQSEEENKAIRSFIQILQLHQVHDAGLIEVAVEQALKEGIPSLTGVRFCLNRLTDVTPAVAPLDLSTRPELAQVGHQSFSVANYDQFLGQEQLEVNA